MHLNNDKPERTFEQIYMDVQWRIGFIKALRTISNLMLTPDEELLQTPAVDLATKLFNKIDDDSVVELIIALKNEVANDLREILIRFRLQNLTESMRNTTLMMVEEIGGFEALFGEV